MIARLVSAWRRFWFPATFHPISFQVAGGYENGTRRIVCWTVQSGYVAQSPRTRLRPVVIVPQVHTVGSACPPHWRMP